MSTPFLKSLRLDGFLSFPPDTPEFELLPLNVIIGPNGSGKSNLFEAIELLRSTPTNFANAIRDGGGPSEWLWKGQNPRTAATIEVIVNASDENWRDIRYLLEFTASNSRVEVVNEAVEEKSALFGQSDVFFYYRFNRGRPVINVKHLERKKGPKQRHLERSSILPDQSVLAQRKDPDIYPELTWIGQQFGQFQSFREWTFGRYASLRQPQPTDLPDDVLLPDCRNLALILNQIEHTNSIKFNGLMRRFFPRFERMSTRISGGTVQFYLHEVGFSDPISSTRLSDGTIRFVAILATLLSNKLPPVICIEEPELGLHPDSMAILAELFVEASTRSQIVITTHSEALVSALSDTPEHVVTCERPGSGTVLRRLKKDDLVDWLERYRLGDLWRMGELGANP